MSYNTSIEGELLVDPPLNGRELRELADMTPDGGRWDVMALRPHIETEEVETDEGTLTKRTAHRLVPWTEDPFRASDFEDHVLQVVRHFSDVHNVRGEFEGHGERYDDIWRLYVWRDNAGELHVTKVTAVITWPLREQGEEIR